MNGIHLALKSTLRCRLRPNLIKTVPRLPNQPRLYHLSVQPNTWKTWLIHRRDGTPRSKFKGAIFTTLTAGVVYYYLYTRRLWESFSYQAGGLFVLVGIQKLDTEYASYDFTSTADTVVYLLRVMATLPNSTDGANEELARTLRNLMETKQEAYIIARECIEDIHAIVSQGKEEDPVLTGLKLLAKLKEIVERLTKVVDDGEIRNVVKGQTPSEVDSYDIVG